MSDSDDRTTGLRPPEPRYLDAMFQPLFAAVQEEGALPGGWRVVAWEVEQGVALTLRDERTIWVLEFERRDDSLPCAARTNRFNLTLWWPFGDARDLTPEERQVIQRVAERVREWEAATEFPEPVSISRPTLVRQILVDRLLVPEGNGQYYINPYVGCMIGCDFCFVADRAHLSRELEGLPRLPWGRWLDVKVNAPEVLAREVRQFPPGPVRVSPVLTDPYQPAERRFRITRGCLEVLVDTGFVPLILTRAERVLEDLDLFRRFPRIAIGFSIPSDDERMRAIFEPGADPLEARFAALRVLREAGVRTFAVVQPLLPMNPDRLVDRLAPLVSAVRIDRMHHLHRSAHLYRQHGLESAMTDSFAREMQETLRRGFEQRGVFLDDMDNMAPLTD